jgi:hypothetical protein
LLAFESGIGVKKDPLSWAGSGSGNFGFSDRRQPLAPLDRVVVVIMVIIMPKPRRTPKAAPEARKAVEEASSRCIMFFRDWDPICASG